MLKLIFIRHPETLWNAQQKYLGSSDIALSKNGKKQAKIITDYLSKEKILSIYSSNLARTKDAALALAKKKSLKLKIDKNLGEINFGAWEGLTFNQIKNKHPKLARLYLSNPLKFRFPQGESFLEFKKRVERTLQQILKIKNGTIVIFSHSGTNKIITCSLLKLSLDYFFRIKQDLGAINIIEIHPVRDSGGNKEAQDKYISNGARVISLINHTLWEN